MNLLKELERLKELHGRFLSQAQVILGLLEQGDEEALADAWYQRELLFNELDGLHQYLAPAFARWQKGQGGPTPAQEECAFELLDQVRDLGQQSGEIDRSLARLLKARRDELALDLGRLKQGQQAQKAYGGGSRRWWGPDRVSRLG